MTHAELLLDLRLTLGEGPIWDSGSGKLIFVDILRAKLFRYDPSSKDLEELNTEHHVGTVVVRGRGGLILARSDGFVTFDPETYRFSRIVDPEADRDGTRFNDGKCDPSGRLWAGTMSYDFEPNAGRLYRLDPGGAVHQMASGFTVPNGIVWSADRNTMYHIDSPRRCVFGWDYDDAAGTIKNRRIAFRVPEDMGIPDGMSIDNEDRLWIALWGGYAVGCFDPRDGKLLERVEVPCSQVTACAFGGPDLRTLYITTARENLDEKQLEREPTAGGVFVATPGATGVQSVEFAG